MEKHWELVNVKLDLIRSAIQDCQDSIRALDFKASAVLIIVGAVLSVVGQRVVVPNTRCLVLLGVVSFFLALVQSVMVLVPRILPRNYVKEGDYSPRDVFFIGITDIKFSVRDLFQRPRPKMKHSVTEISSSMQGMDLDDLENELVWELLKVSYIREVKVYRINWSFGFVVVGVFLLTVELLWQLAI